MINMDYPIKVQFSLDYFSDEDFAWSDYKEILDRLNPTDRATMIADIATHERPPYTSENRRNIYRMKGTVKRPHVINKSKGQ